MKRVLVVARHEFLTTVKRWGFLLVVFGIPLLGGGVMALTASMQSRAIRDEQGKIERARLAFVDESGIAVKEPPSDRGWIRYATFDEAQGRMTADRVELLIRIPKDYVQTGLLPVTTTIRPSLTTVGDSFVPDGFRDYLVKCLAGTDDPQRLARALLPVDGRDIRFVKPDGTGPQDSESAQDYLKRLATAAFFFILMFLAISVSGGYLIQGMADEKENRVLETVISSISPVQLMAGKLLGLGAVGLLQVAIWSAMGTLTVVLFLWSFAVNPGLFALCLLYFLLGYLLLGSLLLGLGSMGSNQREATQYTFILQILTTSPVFVWFEILTSPQGTLARVFTYIPLTTPSTMILRLAIDPTGTPWWEVLASTLLLIGSAAVSVVAGARLYRVGLLMYGKRPSPREIWRWMWAG